MAQNDMLAKIGSWAFIIGIVIALIVGLFQAVTLEDYYAEENAMDQMDKADDIFFRTDNGAFAAWGLAVIGAVIGVLAVMGKGTITKSETPGFLMAGIGLLVMGSIFWGIQDMYVMTPWIGSLLVGISVSLSIFVAPAVGILAIKQIYDMGKD